MSGTTTDILLAALFLAGIALFGLAMFGVALRVGPKRGTWNQPAAALVRPGRGVFIAMYAFAIAHVILGLIAAVKVPGAGAGVLVVLVVMAAFYVICAHSFALAARVTHRRHR
jgi:hypothetical protein